MPVDTQKRCWAKGRSAETHNTVVLSTRYFYRLEEELLQGTRRELAIDFSVPLPDQVGDSLFVGPGGLFPDIGSALAVAGPGDNVLVAAGTYPSFTVDTAVRIMADGSGPVSIDTSLMPVIIQNIPGTEPDVALYSLDIGDGL